MPEFRAAAAACRPSGDEKRLRAAFFFRAAELNAPFSVSSIEMNAEGVASAKFFESENVPKQCFRRIPR